MEKYMPVIEAVYEAIKEVTGSDNPALFAQMNETVYKVAYQAVHKYLEANVVHLTMVQHYPEKSSPSIKELVRNHVEKSLVKALYDNDIFHYTERNVDHIMEVRASLYGLKGLVHD